MAKSARLRIDVFDRDSASGAERLVRNIVRPEDGLYAEGVYSLQWCFCDSFDMPVSGGIYSIAMTAFESDTLSPPIFHETIKVLDLFDGWNDLKLEPGDFDIEILSGWRFQDGSLMADSTGSCTRPDLTISQAKFGRGFGSTGKDIAAIKLTQAVEDQDRALFDSSVVGYVCSKDDSQPGGYSIIRKAYPVNGMNSVWPIDPEDKGFLLIALADYCPFVIDPSALIARLKSEGIVK